MSLTTPDAISTELSWTTSGTEKVSDGVDGEPDGADVQDLTTSTLRHEMKPAIVQREPRNFLSLPIEVRQMIYEYLVWSSKEIIVEPRRYMPRNYSITPLPPIMKTCEAIYRDALPTYCSQNLFLASRPQLFLKWLAKIGPRNVRALKSIRLCHNPRDWQKPWIELLQFLAQNATGLRNLYFYTCDNPNYNDGRYWKSARAQKFWEALSEIKVLGKIEVDGVFARRWPVNLEKQLRLSGQVSQAFVQMRRTPATLQSGSQEQMLWQFTENETIGFPSCARMRYGFPW